MSFIAKTNKKDFKINADNNDWIIANETFSITSSKSHKSLITIVDAKGITQEATILSIDEDKKQIKVQVNQKEIIVDLLDFIDQKMLAYGIDIKATQKIKNIKAPMPGLILKTLVTEGQTVKSGEPLFILEAMKMENVFKAPEDVEIKKILIKEGETVDKNQELIVFA